MRPIALVVAMLFVALPAQARPTRLHADFSQRPVDLDDAANLHDDVSVENFELPLLHRFVSPPADSSLALPHFRIGPFTAQIGGLDGQHIEFANYRLEGLQVLGGIMNGRGAKLDLVWPVSF